MKIGDTFEIVEWIEQPSGLDGNHYVGLQCVKNEDEILTPHKKSGELTSFTDEEGECIKKIGKITITKLK